MVQLFQYIRVEQCARFNNNSQDRNEIFYMNVSKDIEINMNTDNLIQTAKIVLPKRFLDNTFAKFTSAKRGIEIDNSLALLNNSTDYAETATRIKNINSVINYSDTVANNFAKNLDNVDESNPNLPPHFMRGDMITIWLGYAIDDFDNKGQQFKLYQKFRGYISLVNASDKVELQCEDFMWYFKQLRLTNKTYNTDPKLTGTNPISYIGASPNVLNINKNTGITSMKNVNKILSSDSTLESYPQNTLNAVIFDALNNSISDYQLMNRGFYPLIYVMDKQLEIINGQKNKDYRNAKGDLNLVPKPYLCFTDNPKYSLGNINIHQNATFYNLLEKLKTEFNQNVYLFQQSPAYSWIIDSEFNVPAVPGISDISRLEPWVGNYLNLGFSRYLPGSKVNTIVGNNTNNESIYQSQIYDIYLNGPDSIVLQSDLSFKRKEDFLVGMFVKSWSMEPSFDDLTGQVELLASNPGKPKKKIYTQNVFAGEYGGNTFTCFYKGEIEYEPNPVLNTNTGKYVKQLKPKSYDEMMRYGQDQLNKVHYSGYYGTIVIIGYPFVNIGDMIKIFDPLYPERDGTYMIKGVKTLCNENNGLTQELTIDTKVTNL